MDTRWTHVVILMLYFKSSNANQCGGCYSSTTVYDCRLQATSCIQLLGPRATEVNVYECWVRVRYPRGMPKFDRYGKQCDSTSAVTGALLTSTRAQPTSFLTVAPSTTTQARTTLTVAPSTTTPAHSTLTRAPIISAPSTLAGAPSFTVALSSGAFTRAPSTNVIMVSIGACTLFAGVTMLTIAIVLLRKRSLQHRSTLQDSLPMHQLPFSPSSPLSISSSCPVLSLEDEPIAWRTRSRRQLDL